MERLHVYVDESGDEHLNVDSGASRNYVLAAVIIRHEMLESVIAAADIVRRFYFQTGEMKSSGIGPNLQRRLRVLKALSELHFHVVAFCVPKHRLLLSSGMVFREVFLKYTAKKLCLHLPIRQEISVSFDSKGRSKFKGEFKAYLEKNFPSDDLFQSLTFDSVDSKKSLPIQIADIYAGSIAKQYELRGAGLDVDALRLLSQKVTVWEWPTNRDWGIINTEIQDDKFDAIVRREAFRRAWIFLDEAKYGDEDFQVRCLFLKWLIEYSLEDDLEFMLSDEISRRFHRELGVELDGQALRNKIVGPLRDSGLLIASSSKGYRLPSTVKDIRRYVDLCSSQIPPALARVRRAREIIRSSTVGELDILAGNSFAELRKAVESISP